MAADRALRGAAVPTERSGTDYDLAHHGDREVGAGLVDLAVNVRLSAPPEWLLRELRASLDGLAAYPDVSAATAAIAARHGRDATEVVPTAGAAEAFTLLAAALRPRHAVVIHPQFTEPEAALRAVGHPVRRVLLRAADGFVLHPELVPDEADLVFVGNPTNPTSRLHPASLLGELCGEGRIVVVDEAFVDALAGEPESLAAQRLPGLVVLRSLTKTWAIAGLRAGYVLAEPEVAARLRARQPPWAVSTPAAAAMTACSGPYALAQADALARQGARERLHLVDGLRTLGVHVAGEPRGPFVLIRVPDGARVRDELRAAGYATRRGDTFPGLDADWIRLAVREPTVSDSFLTTLDTVLTNG